MKIYLAELSFNPQITECEVEEKGKTYKVISSLAITGWTIYARLIKKDDKRICKSVFDALLLLETLSKELSDAREEDFHRTFAQWKVLHDISNTIRVDPGKLDKALAENFKK